VTSWQNNPRMHHAWFIFALIACIFQLLAIFVFDLVWFFLSRLCMKLLAYIDRQEEAKLRVSWRFCFSVYSTNFCPAPLLLTEDCVYMCVPQRRLCWWKRDSCIGGIVWWYVCTTFVYFREGWSSRQIFTLINIECN